MKSLVRPRSADADIHNVAELNASTSVPVGKRQKTSTRNSNTEGPTYVAQQSAWPTLPLEAGNVRISSTTVTQARINDEVYGTSLDCTFTDDEVFGPRTRLLQIKPGVWHQPICCDLRTAYIFEARYTALSYSWGTGPRSSLILIGPEETHFAVSDHVCAALRRLRHRTEAVSVWVDGICINQDNVIERQAQIRIMAQIFSAAEEVLIWLGEGEGLAGLQDDELFWRMCQVSNPWWKRLWVVQECAYANDCPMVQLGSKRFSLEAMVGRWEAVIRTYAAFEDPGNIAIEDNPEYWARLRRLKSHLGFLRMLYEAWKAPNHRIPLLSRLRQTSKRQCTISHDVVFAILSLVDVKDAERVPLDYRLPFPHFKKRIEDILRQSPDWNEPQDSQLLLVPFEELTKGTNSVMALLRAADVGDIGALKILLRHDEILIDSYEAILAYKRASRLGHEDFAQHLLRRGVDLSGQSISIPHRRVERPSEGESWLSIAALSGDAEAATQLYKERFDAATGAEGRKDAVASAAYGGHKEVVRTLIHMIVERASEIPSLYGYTQMTAELFAVRLASVAFMDAGELLSYAAMSGNTQIVRKVLDTGMYEHAPQRLLQQLMEEAAYQGYQNIVKVLLDNGTKAAAGWSALPIASAAGHASIVQMLLQHGANANESCPDHGSALSAASAGGHTAVVQILLDHGADVNAPCSAHGNAWSAASRAGHRSIEEMLQTAGADVVVRDPMYGVQKRSRWQPLSWRSL